MVVGEDKKNMEIIPATKIAVLDGSRLKAEATCFKAHNELENMLEKVVSNMHETEIKAKAEYEKTKNDKKLSKEEIRRNIEKIEEDWENFSIKFKEEVQNIKNMDTKLSTLLQSKLEKIIEDVSKTHKIDIILNSKINDVISVFYSTGKVNVTNLVVKKLNKILPHVDLEKLK
jgi:Skp family chaperone for outer membrane proteins